MKKVSQKFNLNLSLLLGLLLGLLLNRGFLDGLNYNA